MRTGKTHRRLRKGCRKRMAMTNRVFVVDDDPGFRRMLVDALDDKGFEVECAASAEEGLDVLKQNSFDFILMDVKLPGMTGIEALDAVREADHGADVIIMTAYSEKDTALTAIAKGAYDFFSKPFSLREMEIVLTRAMERRRMRDEIRSLKETLRATGPMERIIGKGEAMQQVAYMIQKVAALDTTVLITGESGTGKGLIADTLHAMSPRAKEPYIKVNCAAIPETLIESELFGFEKGAFTGAHRQTSGKFELADKGTLLLDEIGDMPVHVQPKLLRVVEEKQVERLGGGRSVDVDVRIISATHQDLPALIGDKKFREDLYYRLNIATIHMPPLRERKEDIPLLAEHFLEKIREGMNMGELGLTPEALQLLMQFDWPGNVRHLANALERAAINAMGPTITASDVERTFTKPKAEVIEPEIVRNASLRETLIQVERNLIESALRRAGGRQTVAADFLGISPKNLWNKIQKHSIDPKEIKRQCGTPMDADD